MRRRCYNRINSSPHLPIRPIVSNNLLYYVPHFIRVQFYDMIIDTHWKTDTQAASLI